MANPNLPEPQRFSLVKRAESFAHAGRGLRIFLRSTHNAWIHLAILIAAIALGFYCHLSEVEWLILVLTSGLVLTAEAINTAIEIDINLTSPEFHPYARDTKDVAAAAVLISAITAIIIGAIIFLPHLLDLHRAH